jgi:hypothetical protein
MPRQHGIDALSRRRQRGIVQRPFTKHRRIARRRQQHVLLPQRYVHVIRQMQQHLTARHRSPGFQEAEVLGGDIRIACKVELAQATAAPPIAQEITDCDGISGHE